jgi:hypothetical protein
MPASVSSIRWSRRDLLLAPLLLVAAGLQALALTLGLVPWSSDQGIVALMGRHIALGISNPIFCYGSYYGGNLEPHLTALVFFALGMTRTTYRVSLMLFLAVLLFVVYAIGRRFFGRAEGFCAVGYLALPPFFFLLKGLTSDGAYDSLAVLGGAIAYAALRLDEEARANGRPRIWFALLGFFAGLAWWVHPVSAYFFIAVTVWFLVVAPRIFLRFRDYPAFLLSFLLGGLPWWIFNLQTGWRSLVTPETTTLPLKLVAVQAVRFFTVGVPVLYGARSYYAAAGTFPGATVLALVVYALPVLASIFHVARSGVRDRENETPKPIRESRTLLLLVLFLFSMQAVTSLSVRTYESDPRFLFPAYVPFSLLIGYWIVRLVRTRLRSLAVAAAVAVAAFHAIGFAFTQGQEEPWQPTTGSLASLIDVLEKRGLFHVYTGYWTAYRLAFESGERIRPGIFGIEATDRYPAYTEEADRSDVPAVILRGEEAARFDQYLKNSGSHAASARNGPHFIFWGMEPEILEDIRRLRQVPTRPARLAGKNYAAW